MKKIVFYSYPAYGHINPTINIARELQKKGCTVIYYSTEEFKDLIESAGVTFKKYSLQKKLRKAASRNIASLAQELLEFTEQALPGLQHDLEQEQPDCIAHDGIAVWGKILGHKYAIPSVSLITTIAFHRKATLRYPQIYAQFLLKGLLKGSRFFSVRKRYFQLMNQQGIDVPLFEDIVVNQETLNLVFTSSLFHPCSEYFDKSFKFIGPSIFPRDDNNDYLKKLDKSKKTIFISLGTVVNDDKAFYHMCLNALQDTDYQVILSLGRGFDNSDFRDVPNNTIVKDYVNQLEVLQHVDLFITHAGMNGVNESLYYGVPMILVPDTDEQTIIAVRAKELGAGKWFKKGKLSKELLLRTIDELLSNPNYKKQAAVVQKSLRLAGGYKKGVEEIMTHIKKSRK